MNKFILIISLIISNISLAYDTNTPQRHLNSTPIYNQQPALQQTTPPKAVPPNVVNTFPNNKYNKPPFFAKKNNHYQSNYRPAYPNNHYQPNYRPAYPNNRYQSNYQQNYHHTYPNRTYHTRPPINNYRNSYQNRRPYNKRYPSRQKKRRSMFDNFNPQKFNPMKPQESMSDFWDDAMDAPTSMGRMPGGWNVPSVTLPNPIDSADDFGKGIREIPKGFNYQ